MNGEIMYREYVKPQCEVIEMEAAQNIMAASGGSENSDGSGNIGFGGSVDKGGDVTSRSVWSEEP